MMKTLIIRCLFLFTWIANAGEADHKRSISPSTSATGYWQTQTTAIAGKRISALSFGSSTTLDAGISPTVVVRRGATPPIHQQEPPGPGFFG